MIDIDAYMMERSAGYANSNKVVKDKFLSFVGENGIMLLWQVYVTGVMSGLDLAQSMVSNHGLTKRKLTEDEYNAG